MGCGLARRSTFIPKMDVAAVVPLRGQLTRGAVHSTRKAALGACCTLRLNCRGMLTDVRAISTTTNTRVTVGDVSCGTNSK